MLVSGTFTMDILPDGNHVNMKMEFPAGEREKITQWLKFAYCNDLVWRVHAMQGDGSLIWMSTVTHEMYRHLFRHISGDQYLIPAEAA